jgi:hypothetical protein
MTIDNEDVQKINRQTSNAKPQKFVAWKQRALQHIYHQQSMRPIKGGESKFQDI